MEKKSSQEKGIIKARWEILIDPALKTWIKVACLQNGISGGRFLENAIKIAKSVMENSDRLEPQHRMVNQVIKDNLFKGDK